MGNGVMRSTEKRRKDLEKEGMMDKGKLVGGIVCVLAAGLLGVAMFALPESKVVFMIGDNNVPWVPVIVLAGIGVALLGTSWRRQDA